MSENKLRKGLLFVLFDCLRLSLRHPHNWAQLFNFVFFFTLPTFFLIFIHFRQQLLCRSRIRRRLRRWWWIRSLPNYVQQIGMINYSSAASLILYRDAILSKKIVSHKKVNIRIKNSKEEYSFELNFVLQWFNIHLIL